MPTIKLLPQVKLKNQPLPTKVLLRLITLAEQRTGAASLRTISKELGSKFIDTRLAVEELGVSKAIYFVATTATDFEFEVDPEHRKALLKDASSFDRHLRAAAVRTAKAKLRGEPPSHLQPFDDAQRAPHMEKALVIATHIGAPKLVKKVANCMARLGELEVQKILDSALLAHKSTANPAMSRVALFFTLYQATRDVLVPAPTETVTS